MADQTKCGKLAACMSTYNEWRNVEVWEQFCNSPVAVNVRLVSIKCVNWHVHHSHSLSTANITTQQLHHLTTIMHSNILSLHMTEIMRFFILLHAARYKETMQGETGHQTPLLSLFPSYLTASGPSSHATKWQRPSDRSGGDISPPVGSGVTPACHLPNDSDGCEK